MDGYWKYFGGESEGHLLMRTKEERKLRYLLGFWFEQLTEWMVVSLIPIGKPGEVQGGWGMKSCAVTTLTLKSLLSTWGYQGGSWTYKP